MEFREINRDIDWIHLAQDRNQWQAVVNKVMSLWVPQYAETFLIR